VTWRTFWLEPTGRVRRGLRRYARRVEEVRRGPGSATGCEGGWHDAFAWTGEEVDDARQTDAHVDNYVRNTWPGPARSGPCWPVECDRGCGYQFTEDDHWQTWTEPLYRRTDTGELRVLHWRYAPPDAPTAEAGATWNAIWLPRKGPDGVSLMVRCPRPDGSPGLDWPVDEPSTISGGLWTRTGDPRQADVTVAPSISIGTPGAAGYYHGHLVAGVLSDHPTTLADGARGHRTVDRHRRAVAGAVVSPEFATTLHLRPCAGPPLSFGTGAGRLLAFPRVAWPEWLGHRAVRVTVWKVLTLCLCMDNLYSMTTATERQAKHLSDLQSYLRRDMTETDAYVLSKVRARLMSIAQGAATAAAAPDPANEIAYYLETRTWLTINPGDTREQISARLVALREHIAALTPEQVATLDARTASRYIDAAKALRRA
jgi:hypothetical protein